MDKEKVVLCFHWLTGPTAHSPGVHDVIASFLFGTCTVHTEFCESSSNNFFAYYCMNLHLFYVKVFLTTQRSLWLHLRRNRVFVDIQWQVLIITLTVPIAETNEKRH